MKTTCIKLIFLFIVLTATSLTSCKKYLDLKPSESLSTLESLEDLQAFMDNNNVLNLTYPPLGECLSDNYYVSQEDYNALGGASDRDFYRWKNNDQEGSYWQDAYAAILQSNITLDELKNIKLESNSQEKRNQIMGSAFFFRAYFHYAIAQYYGQPYIPSSSKDDLGIPLRLNSDYSEKSRRSSVKESYERIIMDLKEAAKFLPATQLSKTRPCKPAAFGALARTYLAMQEYDSAGVYADRCLKFQSALIDYNTLDTMSLSPIKRFNSEVIFYMRSRVSSLLQWPQARIDSSLYKSYSKNDLRRVVFFHSNGDNSFAFKGDYDGGGLFNSGYVFSGIVTDEMYLIRAEAYARSGDAVLAVQDLNTLLSNRWKKNSFIPLTAGSPEDALSKILTERRKELLWRGSRWTDLRRLKNESNHLVVPKRFINGELINLLPSSTSYTLKIPITIIQQSGMAQNP